MSFALARGSLLRSRWAIMRLLVILSLMTAYTSVLALSEPTAYWTITTHASDRVTVCFWSTYDMRVFVAAGAFNFLVILWACVSGWKAVIAWRRQANVPGNRVKLNVLWLMLVSFTSSTASIALSWLRNLDSLSIISTLRQVFFWFQPLDLFLSLVLSCVVLQKIFNVHRLHPAQRLDSAVHPYHDGRVVEEPELCIMSADA